MDNNQNSNNQNQQAYGRQQFDQPQQGYGQQQYNQPQQPPFYSGVNPNGQAKDSSGMTFGILSIIFGILFAPVGLVLSIIGLVKSSKNKSTSVPTILNWIGLGISALFLVLLIFFLQVLYLPSIKQKI